MRHVIACIDASPTAPAVADYAAWASLRLGVPLTFLHVLDKSEYPVHTNLSGNIGLGSREALLEELAELDAQRARLAMEQGQLLLDAARERAEAAGVTAPATRQRRGALVDTLANKADMIRLLVIGRQGTQGEHRLSDHIGSQVENVVRTLHQPILVATPAYREPRRFMLAFDGSPTTRKGVQMLAGSPLLRGLPGHLVHVGEANAEIEAQLDWARGVLEDADFQVSTAILDGEVERALCDYRQTHDIDLLAMGAYGHTRIRRFLVGSTTTALLRGANIPVLLLR